VTTASKDMNATGYCFLSYKGDQFLLEVLGWQRSPQDLQANRSIPQRLSAGLPVPLCCPLGGRLPFRHESLVCSACGLPAEPASEAASAGGDLWGRHMPAAE